ncbi:helix-turn-helix domain-containing protein [Erwinia sp. SLM-02]|uniref:helix-turn-helix domain-containing protein n=1 Tax=Erwinia sp. SLM-02 TaxID=3020057 RepID=UPI0028D4C740|nr:XRE family transcriptional regulator [uncultured Erwinia sp.]
MDDLQNHLAQMLKTQRTLRGWSLSQAAEMTGVSKAMLGQIERAESSPTIATLWKIATGFNLPFSLFINGPATPDDAPRQPQHLPAFRQPNRAMQVQTLFPFDAATGFEMLVIELAPGAVSESAPHEAGVIEHAIVIEGRLELCVTGVWQSVAAGDALRFQADRPHAYRNSGEQPVRFYNLIHYPHR